MKKRPLRIGRKDAVGKSPRLCPAESYLRTLLQNERAIRQNTAPRAVITLAQSQNVRFVSGDILKETVAQVWYTNTDNEDAAGLTYGGQVYVGTQDNLATQKELSKGGDRFLQLAQAFMHFCAIVKALAFAEYPSPNQIAFNCRSLVAFSNRR